jgi:transcriptional antiterminator NusG
MKRWYVLQVYAGFEDQVVADLKRQIEQNALHNEFGEILIPSAKTKEFFSMTETKDQRLFPGYILIEMEQNPDLFRMVASTPKVLKFLGGKDPVALSKGEIERVLASMKGEVVVSSDAPEFSVGSEIEIISGPFAGFVGIINDVDKESERLTVMVSIFGRLTPVELGFDQVKR